MMHSLKHVWSRAARNPSRTLHAALVLVAASAIALLGGCIGPDDPIGPDPSAGGAKRGYVQGQAKDSQGRPMSGVTVLIQSSTTGFFGSTITTVTDANGRYEVKVPDAQWRVHAWTTQNYGGQTFHFGLHPSQGDWYDGDSSAGVVRDFVWKISGEVPRAADPRRPTSYYGGAVGLSALMFGGFGTGNTEVENGRPNYPAGSRVEVTLTPRGALIDGSQGRVMQFTRTYDGGYGFSRGEQGEEYLLDIPIGTYAVTARITEPGGATYPGRVSVQHSGNLSAQLGLRPSDFAPSWEITFPRWSTASVPYRGNQVSHVNLYVLR